MPARSVTVPADLEGKRLDVALAALVPGLSRSAAHRLIEDGQIGLSHGSPRPSRGVAAGEILTITLQEAPSQDIVASQTPIQIVYQDSDLMILDKQAGVPVHPSAGHRDDTLVNAILGHDPAIAGVGDRSRPGIVHRLDKDTSGLIAVARTPSSHAALARQWRDRIVVKRYWALVNGRPRMAEGLIEMPIGRDQRNRKRMAPALDGRPARTRYRTIHEFRGFTLLEVEIETGRTHQIRVHLAALGHPIAGDRLYGGGSGPQGLKRQFLHACFLGLYLPSNGEYREFVSPLPSDLEAALDTLQD